MELAQKIFNLKDLIQFRRKMHCNAEPGYEELVTQESIKHFLLKSGLEESALKKCAQTGWVVDIWGKAEQKGDRKLIALRADIDALLMTEANEDLEYRSKTDADHACGHDGHTTTLLGFTQQFLEIRDRVPSNKGVRLLFQPCEEGARTSRLSGAQTMIAEGCLEGVDECYGYHNWPTHPVGYLLVKEGCQMAASTVIKIDFIGLGGHGSTPEKCIDPVQMAVDFHVKFREMKEKKFKDRAFISNFPTLQAGERFNVIADSARITGMLRSLELGLSDEFERGIRLILEEIKSEYPGSDYKLHWTNGYQAVMNTEKETQIVVDLAKQQFGEDKVGEFGILPAKASEDFSYYLQKVPGCFYFLGSGRKFNDIMLHDNRYDFNDNLIEPGAKFFLSLIKHRLEL